MEAPQTEDMPASRRSAVLKTYGKLKQADLAVMAEKAFEGTGYLPDLLVTPLGAGRLDVVDVAAAGVAAE